MFVDLSRLERLLDEARRCAETQVGYAERADFAAAREKQVLRAGDDAAWITEMAQDYRSQAQAAAEQLAELERAIHEEALRQERFTGSSIPAQLELARFLDEHGRDGLAVARRAVMLLPVTSGEALLLSSYLAAKGHYDDAITAARAGWQRFGDHVLRAHWADLLARSGPSDDLLTLLREDLRTAPDDLSLMERLAALLVQSRRLPEAYEVMQRALAHPAGASRLLAEFMQSLVMAQRTDLAVKLGGEYLAHEMTNKMAVRRELAETLRRAHLVQAATIFLDDQVARTPADRDLIGYRPTFLVNSLRSEDRVVRQETLDLLRTRRDPEVVAHLRALFAGTRGDELRLLVIESLVYVEGPAALPLLEQALAVSSRRVRLAAARAIGQLGAGLAAETGSGLAAASAPAKTASAAARRMLLDRLALEPDDGVRQSLADALHQLDPRPRHGWERVVGRRPWAESSPEPGVRPEPGRWRRRAPLIVLAGLVLVIAALMLAPIQPSPRVEIARLWAQGAGLIATRQAGSHITPTPVVTPGPTATRADTAADMASGQASTVAAADTVRVQLSGQIATVRYIGIDVPAPGQPGARTAQDANRNLVVGRTVYLEQGAIPRDTSGRWLRYVWLPEGQMANERLLELGYAAPAADPQDAKYQPRLADAATRAWQNRAGFWRGGDDVFPMAAVKSPEANIREGPGTDQPVKAQVKQGSVYVVLGRNEGADWLAVRISGFATGWMAVQVVDTTVPAGSLPVVK